eukprot:2277574-Pleurochrysis_carterae.AAC.3
METEDANPPWPQAGCVPGGRAQESACQVVPRTANLRCTRRSHAQSCRGRSAIAGERIRTIGCDRESAT